MHLVDEQHGLRAAHAQRAAGGIDRGADVLDPGADRGKLHETALGHLADHIGQRGLAGAGRPPEQQRHRRVVVDQLAERRARAGQVPLADHLVQGARPHPDRERGGRLGRRCSASSNRLSDCPPGSPAPCTALAILDPISLAVNHADDNRAGLSTGGTPLVDVIHRLAASRGAHRSRSRSMSLHVRRSLAYPSSGSPGGAIARSQGAGCGHRTAHHAQPGPQRPLAAATAWRVRHLLRGAYPRDSAVGRAAPGWAWCRAQPPDGSRAARPDRRAESGHHHHGSGIRTPARAKIPGIVIHRSDAVLRTRHPAMLPPCTRVEDTVLDLIQVAPSFDDAYAWICRAIGRRRTTADRIRLAMDARKKMRWRREIAAGARRCRGRRLVRAGIPLRPPRGASARAACRAAAGEDQAAEPATGTSTTSTRSTR